MTSKTNPTTRRTILIGAAALTGLPILAAATSASAAGTLPKANAHYQDHPNGAKQCSGCNYFLAKAAPDGGNLCKVVAGPIAANAYCTMYAPKHAA